MAKKNNDMILKHNIMILFEKTSNERIVYICAPAGYGKTVSVRLWMDHNRHKNAFISLDEFDNELSLFCSHFCAALLNCQPMNPALRKITLHDSFDAAPTEFTVRAIGTLKNDERAYLILDDVHFINNEKVLNLLASLLKRLPDVFQIFLISRNELPPNFSELFLKGSLAQITADDLRFSKEDVMSLYKAHNRHITVKEADEIQRFTDGWAIGIGAVLLSREGLHEGNLRYLDDFIRTDVWSRWDENSREFMLNTSVVRELTPSLCTALTGETDSEQLLEMLIAQNVFITRSEDGVYRYHRLFRDFLSKTIRQRGYKYVRRLLEKAGWWYLSQEDFYNAMDCFIRCESIDGIIKSFIFLAVIDRKNFIVDKILPLLKTPLIIDAAEKLPLIYSMLAWAAFVEGHPDDMETYADRYYKKQLKILRYDLRLAFFIFFTKLIDFRVTIRKLMGIVNKFPVSLISEKLNGAEPSIAIINQYMPLLHRGTRDFSECAGEDIEGNVANLLKGLGGLFGDEAPLLAESITAGLLYEQGHLEKAHSHALAANAEIADSFAAETKFCAMSVLACVLDALGDVEQANAVVRRICEMIECSGAYSLSYNFNAFSLRRKLGKGDVKAASEWLTKYADSSILTEKIDFYKIYGHFTTCRAYITKGEYDSAIIILKKALALNSSYNRPLDVIEARILLAIAYWKKKRGFQNDAMQYLEEAVSKANIYGFTQIFINEGAELFSMLRRLQRRIEQRGNKASVPSSFIKKLYFKTLGNKKEGLTSGLPEVPVKYTDKQMNVMRLLCEGKSYREISASLGIKIPTLRSHIALIYKKLNVTYETDAVEKIKALEILKD